jgi:hypothetical protein
VLPPPASGVHTGRGFEHVPIFEQIEPFVVQIELEIPQRIDAARTRVQEVLLAHEKFLASDESESMILFGAGDAVLLYSPLSKSVNFC